jgi:hypothetical protein
MGHNELPPEPHARSSQAAAHPRSRLRAASFFSAAHSTTLPTLITLFPCNYEKRRLRTHLKNVTITLDVDTIARARVHAAERNMSLSRYIGEVLRAELRNADEYERAMRGWHSAKSFPLKGPAERYPKREDLHDRAARKEKR